MQESECVSANTHMTTQTHAGLHSQLASITLRVYSFSSKKHYFIKKGNVQQWVMYSLILNPWIATTHTYWNGVRRDENEKIKKTLINRKGEVMCKTNRKVILPSLHIYLCVNGVSGGHTLHPPLTKKHIHREKGRELGALEDQSSLRRRLIFHVHIILS